MFVPGQADPRGSLPDDSAQSSASDRCESGTPRARSRPQHAPPDRSGQDSRSPHGAGPANPEQPAQAIPPRASARPEQQWQSAVDSAQAIPPRASARPGQQWRSAAEAAAVARAALRWLAEIDVTELTCIEQAECLRELERVSSAHLAARSRVLAGFEAAAGHADDGHGSARTWLRWQSRITSRAAADALAWMRRLNRHRAIADALAIGQLSGSWARMICEWTEQLPGHAIADADLILIAAASAGADLSDLGRLADEMRRRMAPPDADDDGGFGDRSVRLDLHFRGAGRLDGELTPRCAAALAAVLESLGKKAGPEDTRTAAQRRHDALEEACRRLLAAKCLPDRAGQPTQIQLMMTLDQLLGLRRNDSGSCASPGPAPTARPGDDCDASVVPMVIGHVDHELLDKLAAALADPGSAPPSGSSPTADPARDATCHHGDDPGVQSTRNAAAVPSPDAGSNLGHIGDDQHNNDVSRQGGAGREHGQSVGGGVGGQQGRGVASRARGDAGGQVDPDISSRGDGAADDRDHIWTGLGRRAARDLALSRAIAVLSGPTGLAACLRRSECTGPAASISLPLDVGAATETIPPHLRRAVIQRDGHCVFPGCRQPPAACQVHHLVPRSAGGTTSLTNLVLLCPFHHLTAVHLWGWTLILHADGTTTAISPGRDRVLRSHSPPAPAA
jgi:Domain of unknown function (DUF222)/HNH endonuclease